MRPRMCGVPAANAARFLSRKRICCRQVLLWCRVCTQRTRNCLTIRNYARDLHAYLAVYVYLHSVSHVNTRVHCIYMYISYIYIYTYIYIYKTHACAHPRYSAILRDFVGPCGRHPTGRVLEPCCDSEDNAATVCMQSGPWSVDECEIRTAGGVALMCERWCIVDVVRAVIGGGACVRFAERTQILSISAKIQACTGHSGLVGSSRCCVCHTLCLRRDRKSVV